jgi:hypothetical protein
MRFEGAFREFARLPWNSHNLDTAYARSLRTRLSEIHLVSRCIAERITHDTWVIRLECLKHMLERAAASSDEVKGQKG